MNIYTIHILDNFNVEPPERPDIAMLKGRLLSDGGIASLTGTSIGVAIAAANAAEALEQFCHSESDFVCEAEVKSAKTKDEASTQARTAKGEPCVLVARRSES